MAIYIYTHIYVSIVLLVVMTGVKAVLPSVLRLFFETVCANVHMPVAGIHGRIRLDIKSMADCLVC